MDVLGFFRGKREAAKPKLLQGTAGFVVTGGYIQSNEINTKLQGQTRWKTASDILTNISIVAAGVRYTLNLIARPAWQFEPADESAEAQELADFAQSVLDEIEGTWTATVRRMALYRWHGFGLHEWQAKEREDGRIGIEKVVVRPCHTVERWDIEPDGSIKGVFQKRPVDGKEIYLPRAKSIYLVDDSLTDNPEGMGWFRHLVEPAARLKRLLEIEVMGFERDLNGIPVGRAPISEINAMVGTVLPNGETFSREDAEAAVNGLKSFVRMEAKKPGTGVLLDSQPHTNMGADGETLTNQPMWDIDLLTSDPNGLDAIAKAVERLEYEMALVIGTESMLTGRGGEGSRALSEDKSRNLYLLAESTLSDMTEAVKRDLLGPVWAMNGLPDELMPKPKTEGVSFKDAAHIAQVLKDMATAGAVLAPDDPAIDDLRKLLDLPPQPELSEEERGILMGTAPDPNAQLGAEGKDKDREQAAEEGDKNRQARAQQPPGGKPPPKGGPAGKAYNPDQPRHPKGSDQGGEWASQSVGVVRLKLGGGAKPGAKRWVDAAADAGFVTNPLVGGELLTSDPFNPTGEPIGGITVRDSKEGWHVSDVRAISRGGGRVAMEKLIEQADLHGVTIDLAAVPLESPAGIKMEPERLMEWYGGFGFVPEGGMMVRKPVTEKRYNPNQPRDPAGTSTGGQWTSTGATEGDNDNEVLPLDKETKRKHLIEPNKGKSVEQMREEAFENQERLRDIAAIVEEKAGVDFDEPPKGFEVKSLESVTRKIRDEGYAGPHEITDYSRASFIVDSPEEADGVIAALSEHGRIYDKGWKYLDEYGYLDRKIYMVHPNDGVSEIQITPRGVYQFKMGQGHQLYEIARKATTPYVIARTAARKSRRQYNRLIRDEGFEGLGK